MVSIQVDDVHTMFNDIERMRLSGWTQVQVKPTIDSITVFSASPFQRSSITSERVLEDK